MATNDDKEYHGTKRGLEVLRIKAGAFIIARPRYRTLAMDARVRVDADGTIYYGVDVVGQCMLLKEKRS